MVGRCPGNSRNPTDFDMESTSRGTWTSLPVKSSVPLLSMFRGGMYPFSSNYLLEKYILCIRTWYTRNYGNEERDRRLEVVKLLTVLR